MSNRQLSLLSETPDVTALQVWRLALPCAFGSPTRWGSIYAVGWRAPHHCLACLVAVERGCLAFDRAVARGEFDAAGYTPAERRAQARRVA
jgi:hypothetical protein